MMLINPKTMKLLRKTMLGFIATCLLVNTVTSFDVNARTNKEKRIKLPDNKVGDLTKTGLYNKLNLCDLGLSETAYEYAMTGYNKLLNAGKITRKGILTIIDFTKSSSEKRLFILDIQTGKLLFHTWVAHGKNSGTEYANSFSNEPESLQSSLGFYLTGSSYEGKNGLSMLLKGLEKGINNKAQERAVVMHGADYVSESVLRSQGFMGRSWGCPAVSEKLTEPIIQKIKGGSLLFIYAKDKHYVKQSKII
jgi:hypothetical protein